ncbi:MAG: hypothetical protein RIT81_13785 [Deltaproteobacteria bacterium]
MSDIKLFQINVARVAQLKAETGSLEKSPQCHIELHHATRSGDLEILPHSIADLHNRKPHFVRAFEDN